MGERPYVQADGEEISRRRKAKNLSRETLAEKAGHHEREIDRLEHSGKAFPRTIQDLAEVLGCEYEDLLIPPTGVARPVRARAPRVGRMRAR